MAFHKFVLDTGEELGSDKVMSVSTTATSVVSQDADPGAVCSIEVSASFWGEAGSEHIAAGTTADFYTIVDGKSYKIAKLIAEKPVRTSANVYSVVFYDFVTKTDKDLSEWTQNISEQFPMNLSQFVTSVCEQCGVELHQDGIGNPDFIVQSFPTMNATGRDLLGWASQICGQYVTADADGKMQFRWYKENAKFSINPTGSDGASPYYRGELQFSDYTVKPIVKVQLKQSEDDVGVIYPPDVEDTNAYTLSANPLIFGSDTESLENLAQFLYNVMSKVSYTPMSVKIPYSPSVRVGDIIRITDSNGVTITTYLTGMSTNGKSMTLTSVGNESRTGTSYVNSKRYEDLEGRVLNIKVSVDGLSIENKNLAGDIAALELKTDGIDASVRSVEQRVDSVSGTVEEIEKKVALSMTSEEVTIAIEERFQEGVESVSNTMGRFDKDGFRISKSGEQMESLLNNNGLMVTRSSEEILTANDQGVNALNLTSRQYLIIGKNARFEDYDRNRTACFWIGS